MKKLYKFYWDCGRQGCISGLFISTDEELGKHWGTELYFGECLGKHSEIYGVLEKHDVTEVCDDAAFIDMFSKCIGESFGKNPLNYLPEE